MLLSGFIAKDSVVSNNYYLNITVKQGRSIVPARAETGSWKFQSCVWIHYIWILLYLSKALLL